MLALAERFDLDSGAVLAEDVPEAERPLVRVWDGSQPPPEPPVPNQDPAVLLEDVGLPDLPAWGGAAREGPVSARELAAHLRPGGPASGRPELERPVRRVLAQWDFRDPDGWRGPLHRCLPAGGSLAEEGLRAEAADLLGRFAASPLREALAGAAVLRRESEYLLALEGGVVAGLVDVLWQDARGRWHLVFYGLEPALTDEGAEGCWQARLPELVLAARAVQEATGEWPLSVTLALPAGDRALSKAGSRLPAKSVLQAAGRALARLAGARPGHQGGLAPPSHPRGIKGG
jgi:hypothetical protein